MNLHVSLPTLRPYQRTSLFLIWAFLMICAGSWFYFGAMRPSLTGLSDSHIAADSYRYMMMGDQVRTGYIEPWLALALTGFPNTLWTPISLSYVLQTADWITVFDLVVFTFSVLLLRATFRINLQYFLPLLFLNVTTLISVLSLNKEILDLASTALLCFAIKRRLYWLLPVPLLLAFFNRFEFGGVLFLFLFLRSKFNFLRERRLLCFLILLIALNFVLPSTGVSAIVDRNEDQKVASVGGTAVFLNALQLHYLFVLACPLKVGLSLVGEVLNFNKIANYALLPNDYANTYVLLLNNLADVFVIPLLVMCKRFTLRSDAIFLAVLIALFSAISGVIQPRYFYLVYVLFCVALSTPTAESSLDPLPRKHRPLQLTSGIHFVFPRVRFSR